MQALPSVNQIPSNSNFKAVSIVQIPKKAFSSSDVRVCQKEFTKVLGTATGSKLNGFLVRFISLFTTKFDKTANILESFSNFRLQYAMQKHNVHYPFNWLKHNTGLPIKSPLDKNFHSFYVFTKEHKECYMEAMKKPIKNIMKYAKEGHNKYTIDKQLAQIYPQIKMGYESDAHLEKAIEKTPIKKLKINSLDELKDIVKELDI